MSIAKTIEDRLAALEILVGELKAKLFVVSTAPAGETSTERPIHDYEIRIGRDKGKTPSQLSSSALDSLAAFMERCAANPQAGKEQYVDSNRKAAGNYRRWAAYKRAVEQGIVTEPAAAYEPSFGTNVSDADDSLPF